MQVRDADDHDDANDYEDVLYVCQSDDYAVLACAISHMMLQTLRRFLYSSGECSHHHIVVVIIISTTD